MAGFHNITAAIVGAGFIGPVHVEGLRRLGVRVKGIAGISPEEAERAAATLGLERAYRNVDELLADTEVSSVHLASPNRLHHDHAMARSPRQASFARNRSPDIGADECARGGRARAAGAGGGGELQPALLPAFAARARARQERRDRRRAARARQLRAGLAALPDRLQLAGAAAGRWRAQGRRRHRDALARPAS